MVHGVARMFFLKVGLYDVDDSSRICGDFFGDGVPYSSKFGLVFGIGL